MQVDSLHDSVHSCGLLQGQVQLNASTEELPYFAMPRAHDELNALALVAAGCACESFKAM